MFIKAKPKGGEGGKEREKVRETEKWGTGEVGRRRSCLFERGTREGQEEKEALRLQAGRESVWFVS